MIVRDHLFVFFGDTYNKMTMKSSDFEYLALNSPAAKFEEIKAEYSEKD